MNPMLLGSIHRLDAEMGIQPAFDWLFRPRFEEPDKL
jgi:hypothetical protein